MSLEEGILQIHVKKVEPFRVEGSGTRRGVPRAAERYLCVAHGLDFDLHTVDWAVNCHDKVALCGQSPSKTLAGISIACCRLLVGLQFIGFRPGGLWRSLIERGILGP